MVQFALSNGIMLMCYGTLLGGLLSEQWLGRPEPTSRRDLPTASLGKYYQFVRDSYGWDLFQELLRTLQIIAASHTPDGGEGNQEQSLSIANVAVRWVLQQPAVGSALLGMRLGHHTAAAHIDENSRVFDFELDAGDMELIAVVQRQAKHRLLEALGDCGDE